MKRLRLAAVTLNQTPLDWSCNRERTVHALEEAREQGARLVCLPELCISGYGCEDMFLAPHVQERAIEELARLLDTTRGLAVFVGLPLVVSGSLYNAMAMIVDGVLIGLSCKQHLAGDGIHYEPRWFQPWPRGEATSIQFCGREVPVGDLTYDFARVRVGVEVCRDAWVVDRPACDMAARGVSVLLNPSASHFAFAKQEHRKHLVREGSRLIDGVCLFTNLLGNESGRSIYEGGSLVADRGELIAEGERFSYRDHTLLTLDVEVEERALPEIGQLVESSFSIESPATEPLRPQTTPVSQHSKHDDFGRAVALGLFDYLRKCGARGFVLSLSGGADSASVALLVWLMRRLAETELGAEGFTRRLGLSDPLLTTVYQATKNSSDTTREAARAVARLVGADHHEWEVDTLIDGYIGLAAEAVGRTLTWSEDDIALQNIQARARAPGVWMLANLRGALLLATGNRSESSVGYCTMDGDTAGGLAPLSGIDKAYLLDWLRWMETVGPEGIGPQPELAAITAQQPTAELRPPTEGQTDEGDLMPYAVLDVIERAVVAGRHAPGEVLEMLAVRFPKQAREQLAAWVDRFNRLWRVSQWKRERLAPSFHLDTHNVDPKTWRRYPILSGGD